MNQRSPFMGDLFIYLIQRTCSITHFLMKPAESIATVYIYMGVDNQYLSFYITLSFINQKG